MWNPTERLVPFEVTVLGRNGELIAAVSAVYRRQLHRRPELRRYFLACGRQREVDHAGRAR